MGQADWQQVLPWLVHCSKAHQVPSAQTQGSRESPGTLAPHHLTPGPGAPGNQPTQPTSPGSFQNQALEGHTASHALSSPMGPFQNG